MRQVREMSRMATEMAEQPTALAALIERRAEIEASVATVAPRSMAGTVLVARGSSDHAAAGGRYLLEMASGRPTALGSPSISSRYGASIDFSGYLVIALSQSGRTPEICGYLDRARATGGVGIAITNDASSPLADVADLATGPERAVPATKTVTAEMLALIMVAGAFGQEPVDVDRLEDLPAQVATVLADQGPAAAVAGQLAGAARILTVERGTLQGAALETACGRAVARCTSPARIRAPSSPCPRRRRRWLRSTVSSAANRSRPRSRRCSAWIPIVRQG